MVRKAGFSGRIVKVGEMESLRYEGKELQC